MDAEFISVPEWARRVGCSKDSAYKAVAGARFPVPSRWGDNPSQLVGFRARY